MHFENNLRQLVVILLNCEVHRSMTFGITKLDEVPSKELQKLTIQV